jgi:hypothetical protein
LAVADELTPEMRKAEIARLEAMRTASLSMGSGYADRVAAIDTRLAELKEADSDD